MNDVEDFIDHYEGSQKEIMHFIHNRLTSELGLIDKIRYKIPFYYGRTWICFLNPTKKGNIEIAFVRGNELSNHQNLLESKGRKQVYSMEVSDLSEIPLQLLDEVIQEAILLDETVPYSSRRKKLDWVKLHHNYEWFW